jgi:hypothetical protein
MGISGWLKKYLFQKVTIVFELKLMAAILCGWKEKWKKKGL